jgi:signal transduction histidine kinase
MPKVLVIDDDDALRQALTTALTVFGYETAAATNGADGVAQARAWLPDLILCDVNMPGLDGRAVLQMLRADPTIGTRQIVLMTGNQEHTPLREGMNLGADDYLPKPFELNQLKTCVESRLRRAQTYRRLEDGMLRRHAELFGSTLPHEFMTPLNGILGFAEILKEDLGRVPPEEARQMLGDIEACARRLHRTLLNYLLLARLENSAANDEASAPPPIPANQMMSLITGIAETVARRVDRMADLQLDVQPIAVRAHDSDLRIIVEHLVENAFGYSAAGRPVTVSFAAQPAGPMLKIIDEGRGMTAEQIAQIGVFMQFERRQFEQQGLGIGLALAQRLLERQAGKLSFESVPGQGTTAMVTLLPA